MFYVPAGVNDDPLLWEQHVLATQDEGFARYRS